MKGFFKDFQAFISRGNVMDLAVAVIIGAAFSNIVSSMVKDVINPVLGFFVLKPVENYTGPYTYEALTKAGATVLGYGAFLTAVVQFLLLAFVIFWLIRIVTIVRKKIEAQTAKLLADKEAKQKAEEAAKPAPVPADVQLLQEIRDLLKEKKAARA